MRKYNIAPPLVNHAMRPSKKWLYKHNIILRKYNRKLIIICLFFNIFYSFFIFYFILIRLSFVICLFFIITYYLRLPFPLNWF